MKIKLFSSSKKYYLQIMQWTSAAVLLVIIVLTLTVYLNSQHILLQKEYESNRNAFEQVEINVDMMDTMASNLCNSLYMNSDVRAMMFAKEEDDVDRTARIYRIISTSISANPYIHSVTIYNNYLQRFYNAGEALFYDDDQLLAIIHKEKTLPKLKAVSRNIKKMVNGQKIDENVFSYFMYSNDEKTGDLDNAIVVNIRTEWFLENVSHINRINKEQGDYVFVLDSSNQFIEVEQGNSGMKEWIKKEYTRHISRESSGKDVDFFKSKYKGVSYFVTYSNIESMNISLIKVQKLSEVYSSINSLRISITIIIAVFLVGAVWISIEISKRIYRPVAKLVQQIPVDKSAGNENNDSLDEISYLSNFYRTAMERLDVYKKEKDNNRDIMKQYWLNRLVTESHTINMQNLKSSFEEGKISLSTDENFIVCVMKIDNYKAFTRDYTSEDTELLRFAAINISSEAIGARYKNEGIDMKEDHIVLIIGIPKADKAYEPELISLISETQAYIKEYFKLSLSASVSRRAEDIREITSLYNQAADNMAYRLKFGHSCIITSQCIEEDGQDIKNKDMKVLESSLIEKIKGGDIEEIEKVIDGIFNVIAGLEYDRILISLISIAGSINNAVNNTWSSGIKYKHFDFNAACQNIMEMETLEQINSGLKERVRAVFDISDDNPEKSKDSYIVDAVKEIVEKNYQDNSLSLMQISSQMNISSRRLSKVFKDEMHLFIPDYITEVRLCKAAELLENTSLNVNEIALRIGIENTTYFYKIFKNKFGITPKEYAFKRIMNMSQE